MRLIAVLLAVSLAFAFPARARMGDSLEQTIFRYGAPAGGTGQPGALTSTKIFYKDGLKIVCGYVDRKVEMYTVSRTAPAFVPDEVEALLRTNSQHKNWTPSGNYGPGTYHRADGAIAKETGNRLEITTPKWLAALAKDKAAADQAAATKAAKEAAAKNSTDAGESPASNTDAASPAEAPATTDPTPTTTTP
jgi:hypothetical protein